MSNAIAVRDLEQLRTLGGWLAASESGSNDPKALGAAAALRLALIQELGLPIAAAVHVSLIKGRLKIQSQVKRAIVAKQGLVVLRDEENSNDKTCTAILINKETGEELGRTTFTIEQAERAKLVKPDSNWEKYPERMLWARASGYVIDDFAPAYGLGLMLEEDEDEYIDGEAVEELGGDPGASSVAAGMGPPSPPNPDPGGADAPDSPEQGEQHAVTPSPTRKGSADTTANLGMESAAAEEPRPDKPSTAQLRKLDALVGQMRRDQQITTEQVAELAGLHPTFAASPSGELHWADLRVLLDADEASKLISELGFWAYKHPPADTAEHGQTKFEVPDKAKAKAKK